jgi:hypothetical protein
MEILIGFAAIVLLIITAPFWLPIALAVAALGLIFLLVIAALAAFGLSQGAVQGIAVAIVFLGFKSPRTRLSARVPQRMALEVPTAELNEVLGWHSSPRLDDRAAVPWSTARARQGVWIDFFICRRVCVHNYACAQICAQISFLGNTLASA